MRPMYCPGQRWLAGPGTGREAFALQKSEIAWAVAKTIHAEVRAGVLEVIVM